MQIKTTRANGSTKIVTVNEEPSLTQQQFKDQTDVNNIMKKYKDTNSIPYSPHRYGRGISADNTMLPTYQESLDLIIKADESFASLSAATRKRFHNNPTEMINFLQDPNNKDEATKLGLLKTPETPQPNIQNEILNELKKQTPKTPKPKPDPE